MKRIPKVWQYKPREVYQLRLARWFAGLKGFTIDRGNWIHGPSGKPVAHGWSAFYDKYRAAIVDLIWGAEAIQSPSTDTPIGGYCATGEPGAKS